MTEARKIFDGEILPLFEQSRAAWLAEARLVALKICKKRGYVTADEVRKVCPIPPGIDPRVMGAVFIRSLFRKVAYVNSARRTCHGRPIAIFEMV